MALLGDRVQETTTTAGTGTLTLNGAVTGYVTFNSTFTNGNIVWYVIDDGAGNWEIGTGTVGTGTLTRSVFQSSNANNLVNFVAGAKRVFCTAPYTYLLPDQTGNAGELLTTDGSVPSWSNTISSLNVTGNTTLGDASSDTVTLTGTVQPGVVISGSSSSDALRITQTGAGNALVVEDSANPDSTPFVVDAAGKMIVGATAGVTVGGSSIRSVQVSGTGNDATIAVMGYSNSSTGAGTGLILARSRGAASGDFTTLQTGDLISQINFVGADGTTLNSIAATIESRVDGTPGTNDMPGRLVFSTTRDGASSPTEAMRINSSQAVGIGTALSQVSLYNTRNITGNVNSYGNYTQATIQSDVTTAAYGYRSNLSTAASAFTVGAIYNFYSGQGTLGASSAVSNQYGYVADSTLTGATNNYGFYSNISSGTGRWNFYAAGTADNYLAGKLGIGGAPVSFSQTNFSGTYPTNGLSSHGAYFDGSIPSTASVYGVGVTTALSTADNATVTPAIRHFNATQGTITGGSRGTVVAQYGFIADGGLTGATNNYGFYSNIASGTGRWNFYAAGTAENYFAGLVGFGAVPVAGYKLNIGGSGDSIIRTLAAGQSNGLEIGQLTADGSSKIFAVNNNYLAIGTNNTERMRLDAPGNLGLGVTPSAWVAGWKAIQLNARSSWASEGSVTDINLNVYNDGTDKYIASATAARYRQQSGQHQWYTAPSGTAGNAISFTQAMTLDASGNLLVGDTSNPRSARTYIATSSGSDSLDVYNTNASFNSVLMFGSATRAASTAYDFLYMAANGVAQFRVNGAGTVYAINTTIQSVSDARLKQNIIDATDGLDVVSALRPVRFDWKDGYGNGKKNQLGFIAQEVEAIFPDAVDEWKNVAENDDETYKTVGPGALIPVLVKAIQELSAELNELKAKVNA